MNLVPYIILGIYAAATLFAILAIIYLIIRKRRIKKGETFEKRSN